MAHYAAHENLVDIFIVRRTEVRKEAQILREMELSVLSQTCPEAEIFVFNGTHGISLVILSNVSFNACSFLASVEFFAK